MSGEMMRRANGDKVIDVIRRHPVSREFPNGDDVMHGKILRLITIYAGTLVPHNCHGSLHLPIRAIVDLATFIQVGARPPVAFT